MLGLTTKQMDSILVELSLTSNMMYSLLGMSIPTQTLPYLLLGGETEEQHVGRKKNEIGRRWQKNLVLLNYRAYYTRY